MLFGKLQIVVASVKWLPSVGIPSSDIKCTINFDSWTISAHHSSFEGDYSVWQDQVHEFECNDQSDTLLRVDFVDNEQSKGSAWIDIEKAIAQRNALWQTHKLPLMHNNQNYGFTVIQLCVIPTKTPIPPSEEEKPKPPVEPPPFDAKIMLPLEETAEVKRLKQENARLKQQLDKEEKQMMQLEKQLNEIKAQKTNNDRRIRELDVMRVHLDFVTNNLQHDIDTHPRLKQTEDETTVAFQTAEEIKTEIEEATQELQASREILARLQRFKEETKGGDIQASHYATHLGSPQSTLDKLIELSVDIDSPDPEGKRCIHRAVECGYAHVVEQLTKSKSDVNKRNGHGDTPLHVAARMGHVKIAKLLIQGNADVNSRDLDESTPLHVAAQPCTLSILTANRQEIASILVNSSADIQAKNFKGLTVWDSVLQDNVGRKPAFQRILFSKK